MSEKPDRHRQSRWRKRNIEKGYIFVTVRVPSGCAPLLRDFARLLRKRFSSSQQ